MPAPGTPSVVPPNVDGNWRGTLSSSWGDVAITASLANDVYTPTISGSFALERQGETGKIYGSLDKPQPDSAGFLGTLSVSYLTPGGEPCNGSGQFAGNVTPQSVSFVAVGGGGFTQGNCPDPPMNVRIQLHR